MKAQKARTRWLSIITILTKLYLESGLKTTSGSRWPTGILLRGRAAILLAGRPLSGLNLRAISHAFGSNQVLNNVSVSVEPGELVCLLGPSGCGKTTLLRLAAGLEALQAGQVEIDGEVVADAESGTNLPPEKRHVGLMFQDYALLLNPP